MFESQIFCKKLERRKVCEEWEREKNYVKEKYRKKMKGFKCKKNSLS